jgi:hypothetical protein
MLVKISGKTFQQEQGSPSTQLLYSSSEDTLHLYLQYDEAYASQILFAYETKTQTAVTKTYGSLCVKFIRFCINFVLSQNIEMKQFTKKTDYDLSNFVSFNNNNYEMK